ncbi:hypothetical protein P9112_000763 [Eukaryota sp. TZLM1-RC]
MLRFVAVSRQSDRSILGFHKLSSNEAICNRCIELVTQIITKIDVEKCPSLCVVDSDNKETTGAGLLQFVSDSSFLYFAIFEPSYKTRIATAFLTEFSTQFEKHTSTASSCQAGSMNKIVKQTTLPLKEKFETPERFDSILAAQAELDATTKMMQQNVQTLAERGERLENLVGRSEALSGQSARYYQNATTLKRIMWWRNFKLTLIMSVFGVSIVGYVLLGFIDE